VASVFLARVLGAEQRGIYDLAILIPNTIYIFSTFGLTTAHIVFAGKYPEKRGAIVFHSLAFSAFMGLLTLAFYAYILTSQPVWFQRFRVVGTFNLLLASLLVFLNLAMINLQSGVLGANRILAVNVGTILRPLSRILLVVVLVGFLGLGVTGGIISQLGCFVVFVLFMIAVTAAKVQLKTWRPDFGFFKKTLSFGIKVYSNHISWWILHSLDRYMIAYMIPNSNMALGHYALAAQFATLFAILPQSLQTVFLPHLSVTKDDKPLLTATIARLLSVILFPFFVLVLIGSPLIKLILGDDYAGSVVPFMFLVTGGYFAGSVSSLASYINHVEKPLYNTAVTWTGSVVNVGLNLYFIPRIGIVGAALASCVSGILMAFMTVVCFRHETKLALHQFVLKKSDILIIRNVSGRAIEKASQFVRQKFE